MKAEPTPGYRIRPAGEPDVPLLPAIEASAAELFADAGVPLPANGTTTPPEALDLCRVSGTLWVASDASDVPVGFLAAGDLDGYLHVHELSVSRAHQRRRLGTALMAAAIDFGRWAFIPAITLTTDRVLAWNKPFYAKLGFVELTVDGLPPGHAAKHAHEIAAGFDPARRCVMAKVL
ncbi:MAG: GNAT family N-acetyltransferase [Salinarimonas sp.]